MGSNRIGAFPWAAITEVQLRRTGAQGRHAPAAQDRRTNEEARLTANGGRRGAKINDLDKRQAGDVRCQRIPIVTGRWISLEHKLDCTAGLEDVINTRSFRHGLAFETALLKSKT